MITLTNRQARQFLLLKHGLLGTYQYAGKQGALAFVRRTGCIQFDPVDLCGKNAELTLQSRVKGFTKGMLNELLYLDRVLTDYPDKNLAIMPTEDLPYFERYRAAARQRAAAYPEMAAALEQARAFIRENGAVCSDDMQLEGDFYWQSAIHWSSGTKLSRSVLEQMYSAGELIIHHKKGTRKYYDLAEKHLPLSVLRAPDPFPDEFAHQQWRGARRVNAVGLLANRPSDAWLNIWGLNVAIRGEIFRTLSEEGKLLVIHVEGLKDSYYCNSEDAPLLEAVRQEPPRRFRCELMAPLDPLLWDRKLIKALFGFEYTWEIYTPASKRKYGVYVLPLLYGEQFIGRVEAVCDRKAGILTVKNIWYEDGVRQTKKLTAAVNGCLQRFARFNGCAMVTIQ